MLAHAACSTLQVRDAMERPHRVSVVGLCTHRTFGRTASLPRVPSTSGLAPTCTRKLAIPQISLTCASRVVGDDNLVPLRGGVLEPLLVRRRHPSGPCQDQDHRWEYCLGLERLIRRLTKRILRLQGLCR